MNTAEIIGLLASGAFSMLYIFYPKNFQLLIVSGVMFSAIRAWKRDRLEYRTFRYICF